MTTEHQRGGVGGWVLVPREPTPEMLRAGFLSESNGFDIETPADAPGLVYRAMIAASPVKVESGEADATGVAVPDALLDRIDNLLNAAAPYMMGIFNNDGVSYPQLIRDARAALSTRRQDDRVNSGTDSGKVGGGVG